MPNEKRGHAEDGNPLLFYNIIFKDPQFDNPLYIAVRNFLIIALIIGLILLPFLLNKDTFDRVFPNVEVILSNAGQRPVLFTCQDTKNNKILGTLDRSRGYKFSFRRYLFPRRWCYVYINSENNGFFWAYTVRSKCTTCFWRAGPNDVALFHDERSRWEPVQLFSPDGFNSSEFLKNPPS